MKGKQEALIFITSLCKWEINMIHLVKVTRKYNNTTIIETVKNKGFSLIEVLVAIVILAIITLPILSSFASAAKINANARKQENANALAQKVVEEFKSLTINQLTDGHVTGGDYDFTSNYNPAIGVTKCYVKDSTNPSLMHKNQWIYEFTLANKDIALNPYYEGENGEKYYVQVTLDPTLYADRTIALPQTDNTTNNINTYYMPSFSDINVDSNYVMMNQVYQNDIGVKEVFDPTGAKGLTYDKIKKEVTINAEVKQPITKNVITRIDENGNAISGAIHIFTQTVSLKVRYTETATGAYKDYDYGSTTYNDSEFTENASIINKLNPTSNYNDIKNIYLLYNAFDKFNSSASDVININYNYPTSDLMNKKLNVYVIEQDAFKVDSLTTKVPLKKSNVNVKINNCPVDIMNYGTLNLDGVYNTSGAVNIYSNITGWNTASKMTQYNNITQNSTQSETKYLYNMKVEVWADEKTGNPFLTMTSTKEN